MCLRIQSMLSEEAWLTQLWLQVIAYLVMQQPELLKHIHFEEDYCFNCW